MSLHPFWTLGDIYAGELMLVSAQKGSFFHRASFAFAAQHLPVPNTDTDAWPRAVQAASQKAPRRMSK